MTLQNRPIVALAQTDATSIGLTKRIATHLDAILALKGLEGLASSKRLPGRLFEHLVAAFGDYDAYIAHVIGAEGWRVSCRAGCSACCEHELVRGIGLLEIVAIYRHVRPWSDIGVIYEAAGENAVAFQRLLRECLREDPRPLEADDPRVGTAHLRYNRLRRPCPFLDHEKGVCRIYPVRPIVCRYFFSCSPPAWCDPGDPHYLDRDAIGVDPHLEIKQRIDRINQRFGIKTVNYLSGAFAHFAGDVMQGAPLTVD